MNKRITSYLILCLLCCGQFLLPGCTLRKFANKSYDRAPQVKPKVHQLRDAIPRIEPYHPYGRKDYKLKGKTYRVIKNAKGYVRCGYISWYGTQFHGRETAMQERYDLYGMTAASPELPLPSYVEVTNLRNGKKVIVRVNDRGPYCRKRILDLSYAAATKLGYAEQGITYARVAVIDPVAWHKKHRASKKHKKAIESAAKRNEINNLTVKNGQIQKQSDKPAPRNATNKNELPSKNRDKTLSQDKNSGDIVIKPQTAVKVSATKKVLKTTVPKAQMPNSDTVSKAKDLPVAKPLPKVYPKPLKVTPKVQAANKAVANNSQKVIQSNPAKALVVKNPQQRATQKPAVKIAANQRDEIAAIISRTSKTGESV